MDTTATNRLRAALKDAEDRGDANLAARIFSVLLALRIMNTPRNDEADS